jgi:uncharacterized protein YndB with AHSA1/START domain/pimeloyl-ACP methyl ester carboxylesterase
MNAPVVIKDIANKRLTVEKEFAAPVERVWAAWTDDAKLARWWGPKHWPATSHAFDFREGGRWHYSMTGPDGTQYWGLLNYHRIEPMTTLHAEDFFSDAAGSQKDGPISRWEVTFRKVSARSTRVTTKLLYATEKDLERVLEMGFEAGFTSALDNLNQLLTGRAEPRTVTSADGTPIVYEMLGSGPAVIIVGGAMVTRTLDAHTELAAALCADHTVINYDRRGRGDSGDTAPYAVERELEDLKALIGVAGGSAAVYGLSSGAVLALRASLAGLPITKLVLYEPPFIVDPKDRRPPGDALSDVTKLIAQGRQAAAVHYFMTKVFGMPTLMAFMIRLTPYWKPTLAAANALPYDLTVVGDYTLPPKTGQLTTPALVVYGNQTQPLLKNAAIALAKTLPKATLKELPGVNHQIATADIVPPVSEFLKEKP